MRCMGIGLALLFATSATVSAQGSCLITNLGPTLTSRIGGSFYVSGRAQYDCPNDIRVLADSAVSLTGGFLVLIGRVNYSDPDKTLTAQRVEHYSREGRVVAQGNVLLTDKKSGTVLRAPQGLEYFKARDTTPERINVNAGRPHLTLIQAREGGVTDTTDVDADRMNIVGEQLFRGTGNVVIKRGRLQTTSNEAELVDRGARIALWRVARIVGEDYTLDADSIYGETEADLFRELRAFRRARLDGRDVDINAWRLRILFDSGAVNRLIALGMDPAGGAVDSIRANVLTPDFNLTADSIDALSPKQQLQQVIAVGRALGTRQSDTIDQALPELIRNDWLRGDTVIAFFTEAPDSIKARRAQSDSSFDRVLERLIAAGAEQPASAMYRLREESDTTRQVQVNYITAMRITAIFKDGAVHDVDAEDQVTGVYLQPIRRSEPPASQSRQTRRRP